MLCHLDPFKTCPVKTMSFQTLVIVGVVVASSHLGWLVGCVSSWGTTRMETFKIMGNGSIHAPNLTMTHPPYPDPSHHDPFHPVKPTSPHHDPSSTPILPNPTLKNPTTKAHCSPTIPTLALVNLWKQHLPILWGRPPSLPFGRQLKSNLLTLLCSCTLQGELHCFYPTHSFSSANESFHMLTHHPWSHFPASTKHQKIAVIPVKIVMKNCDD